MALTIDELNIKIATESTEATKGLDRLAQTLEKLGRTTTSTSQPMEKIAQKVDKIGNLAQKSSRSYGGFMNKVTRSISQWRTLHGAFQSVANTFADWFKESNDYIETQNLFTVTMGSASEAAKEYAETVSSLTGIDPKEWMEFQGVFKALTSGFGVPTEKANVMSQNLTQLSYDLSSFFNTDVETAFDKLSSAMSGQVKGLREFGIDTTVASLQQYALAQGIEKSVSKMTQAEKSLLRYNYIIEQATKLGATGDLAKTIATPANALRILNAQLTQMKRALGNIVSVLVAKFIPYIQYMVLWIEKAALTIAKFFGYSEEDFNFGGGADNLSSSFEDAEESLDGVSGSISKIKKQLMGFDELNILSSPDTGGGGSVEVSGPSILDTLEPKEYNFLENLELPNFDEIKEKLDNILTAVGAVSAALVGFKVGNSIFGLTDAISEMDWSWGNIKGNLVKLLPIFKNVLGIVGIIAGTFVTLRVSIEGLMNGGMDWDGFLQQFIGNGVAIGGAALLGTPWIVGAVSIIVGIIDLVGSLKSAIVDGNEAWSNTLSIVLGISAVFGGISVLCGSWIPVAIGGVIATIAVLAIYIDDIWAFIKKIPGWIYGLFEPIAQWIWDNVLNPIIEFFTPVWEGIVEIYQYAKMKYLEIKDGVIAAAMSIIWKVQEIWYKIKEIYIALKGAFLEYIWNPLVDKLASFYNKYIAPRVEQLRKNFEWLKGVFSELWQAAKERLFDKLIKKWEDIKAAITQIRDWAIAGFQVVSAAVIGFISGNLKATINAVLWGIENSINLFIGALNLAIDLINKIPGVSIDHVSKLYIPRLAEGGYVSEGQMFIAREAGPEMVGQIGRKNAVVNNDQIVEGISAGVYRAMMAANGGNNKEVTINATLEMDGEVVGKKVIKYHNGMVMQTGQSPLLV